MSKPTFCSNLVGHVTIDLARNRKVTLELRHDASNPATCAVTSVHTPEQARQMGTALIEAADLAEGKLVPYSREHLSRALEWIEQRAKGVISLAVVDEPHVAYDGVALVARALSETANA